MMKQLTPERSLLAKLESELERKEKVIIKSLIYVGQTCVNEARNNGSYIDQTGNLRSSIGFMVINNGRVVHKGGFQKVKEGSEGSKDGRQFIEKVVSEHSKGIHLIVVAGMNYAAYVEDMGKNVLTTAELRANEMVPQMLKSLGFKIAA